MAIDHLSTTAGSQKREFFPRRTGNSLTDNAAPKCHHQYYDANGLFRIHIGTKRIAPINLYTEPGLNIHYLDWSRRGSLLLLAAMPLVSSFGGRHLIPITSFHGEWLAIMAGLLAWIAAFPLLWQHHRIALPRIGLLPLLLMVYIAIQSALLPRVVFQHAQMAMLYLFWAGLLMALTGLLSSRIGRERIGKGLAAGLIAAAVCVSARELVSRLHGVTGSWGGVLQSNNYGDLLALGLASALYLHSQVKPSRRLLPTIAATAIALGLSLTPSRSVWLYCLSMLGFAARWRRDQFKPLLTAIAVYLAFQKLWSLGILPEQTTQTSAERLYQEIGGTPIRLHIWHVAWQLFAQSPWLGQGFGQFDWGYFQAEQPIAELGNRVEHAHNLILHLLAELGLLPTLLTIAMAAYWSIGVVGSLNSDTVRADRQAGAFYVWLLSAAAILGIHSLLEYPLWYAQFLGIAAILLALGDQNTWDLQLGRPAAWASCGLLVSALWVAMVHDRHYGRMEQALTDYRLRPSPQQFSRLLNVCKQTAASAPLLTPYVAVTFGIAGQLGDHGMRNELALLTDVASGFLPTEKLVYRQAAMQALTGRPREAEQTLRQALTAYPDGAPKFSAELTALSGGDSARVAPLLRQLAARRDVKR